jgi:hypothetical protein
VSLVKGEPQCWVNPEMVGIAAVFVYSSDLVNSLSDHVLVGMPLVKGRPFIHQLVASAFDDVESPLFGLHQLRASPESPAF